MNSTTMIYPDQCPGIRQILWYQITSGLQWFAAWLMAPLWWVAKALLRLAGWVWSLLLAGQTLGQAIGRGTLGGLELAYLAAINTWQHLRLAADGLSKLAWASGQVAWNWLEINSNLILSSLVLLTTTVLLAWAVRELILRSSKKISSKKQIKVDQDYPPEWIWPDSPNSPPRSVPVKVKKFRMPEPKSRAVNGVQTEHCGHRNCPQGADCRWAKKAKTTRDQPECGHRNCPSQACRWVKA